MIRIFAACAPNHEDAESQAVLEWSIRKHASEEFQIIWMKIAESGPFSGWRTNNWPTPFSGFRWAVPELAGFKGRAIYTDSDVIFMDDIAKLFHQPIPGCILAKTASRLCVSLWDCEKAKKFSIPIAQMKKDFDNHVHARQRWAQARGQITPFKNNWNCLDGEHYSDLNDPEIKAIHYTAMRHQPQIPYALKRLEKQGLKHWFDGKPEPHFRPDLIELFNSLLAEAIENGYTVEKYCQDKPFGHYLKASVANIGAPNWAKKYYDHNRVRAHR